MAQRIFITGIGIISAIGINAEENLTSLKEEKTGIGEISLIKTIHQGKFPVAEVKLTNPQLLELLGLPSGANLTRTSMLGMAAAREAFNSASFESSKSVTTGLISATTVGGMDRSELFYEKFLSDKTKGRLRDVVNHECGESTERIAGFLGIRDFVTTISTACSSSLNAIAFGAQLIRSGMVDRVIAGGTDSVTKFTLNGFITLMILDKGNCRPFDETRAGLTLGEGAAYVVLESENIVKAENKKIFCELTGYGNANDAYHQTASSPEGTGAYLAMQKALQMSGLTPGQIDYINVHGTGTQNNDLSEGVAMERLFGHKVPPFSSTKPYTGHTLGAAGAIETVISILSMQNNMIFPNLNFSSRMKELNISPVSHLMKETNLHHVLTNSFGFGGNNSSLVLSEGTAH